MPSNTSVKDVLDNGTNSTNYSTLDKPLWSVVQPDGTIVPLLFGILMIVGVLGNGTLIYTVLKNKSMRNVPNILIVSLSFGDMLLLLVSVPFTGIIYLFFENPFGNIICKLNEYLYNLSMGVSIFTLTALSGDRFLAIVYPMSKHKGKPLLKSCVVQPFYPIPEALSFNIVYEDTRYGLAKFCVSPPRDWPEWYQKAHSMVQFFIFFLIPTVIISAFYCSMAFILIRSSKQMPIETTNVAGLSQQQRRQIEARAKVAKVVFSFVIIFVVCWLPRHIYLLWYYWSPDDFNDFWHIFKVTGYCLTYIYACVNPFALYFLSGQFRKYYNKYLFCWCTSPYRIIDSNNSVMYNFQSGTRRGSTSMSVIKTQSEC
ncbi:hypothetical protein KUTeg_007703 [Tegillarca granosa]|uniref:G-protein coupled receptors family 1 profile domain-containing protein n=1 Tax=Tegillarca granosa TaxID=220873 RepID=A0ABQ9FIJ4_TEGGR|nr:hypothetical protein KUTeg_007703 [Tegillarca granosa]